ncbi:hypothetical protein D3C71_1750640 [compost metagenome]
MVVSINSRPAGARAAMPSSPSTSLRTMAELGRDSTTACTSASSCASVLAALMPSSWATRAACSGLASSPVTLKPARLSDAAMPRPIFPNPITPIALMSDMMRVL